MHRGGSGVPPPPLRRHGRNHSHHRRDQEIDLPTILADACPSSSDQPTSPGSVRRHLAASLMQHHRSFERNYRAVQPASPSSYVSSLEVAPYNPVLTPTSSLDHKGRALESGYSLKTSAELLKVLNRIWSLEEQHASNISLVKALKFELDHSRVRIKALLRDQQADRQEIDDLMKQIAEDKLLRKNKEMDRLNSAVQSVRDELEDERKLRKHSESLHRKLARELSDLKSSLSGALKDLERERKSRALVEDLCDELAEGIRDYEQEMHALKQKSDQDWAGRDDRDRLILHISESWLDERLQMKSQHSFVEKNSVVDKLGLEIEAFLQAKRMDNFKSHSSSLPPTVSKQNTLRRMSLESFPLNEVVSAPQDPVDEEDSLNSDSHCFELNKPTDKDIRTKKKLVSGEKSRGRYHPSILQVKFKEQMAQAMACNQKNTSNSVAKHEDEEQALKSKMSGNCEATEDGDHGGKSNRHENHPLDSHDKVNNLISQILSSKGKNVHPENNFHAGQASPVRPWMSNLTPQDLDISESSKILPAIVKENTLKAKLLEARTKGSRTRLKASKGSA